TLYQLKLLDFGLVRVDCDQNGRLKRAALVGTPAYMAPEQAAGELGDARSDIFSLGVVLFRLVTGQLPFQGSTPMEIVTALATEPAPLASSIKPNLPRSLVELLQRMLAKDPLARPRSAADVAERLLQIEEAATIRPPMPRPNHLGAYVAAATVLAM